MSLHYKAPEMLGALEPRHYHTSADMWSVGLFAEMVRAERGQEFRMEANRIMFRGSSEVSQANSIFSGCSLCQTRELPSLRLFNIHSLNKDNLMEGQCFYISFKWLFHD